MAADRAERLLDLTLPSRWADELAAGLTAAWAKAARRHAKPPTIRRVAAELAPRMRARFGDPERPRKRLRGPARRLVRDKVADKLARAELTIEAEGILAPLITGAEREAERATDRLLAEEALGKDAATWEKGYDWTRDVYGKHPRRADLPPQVWIRTTRDGIEPIPPKRRKR